MSIKTPLEIGYLDPVEVGAKRLERLNADILWSFQADFGPYLRGLREQRDLSIRKLAERVGVSHTYLVRLEAGDKAKDPPTELLARIAETLHVDPRELLTRAGFLYRVDDGDAAGNLVDLEFVAVVLSDELRPSTLHPGALPYFSAQLKAEWLEFARKLATQPDPRALLTRLLGEAHSIDQGEG